MTNVIIRKARIEEFVDILPRVAFKAYSDRFYNKEAIKKHAEIIRIKEGLDKKIKGETEEEFLEYGGCLSIPYTKLSPKANGEGQSLLSFKKYWNDKIEDFKKGKFKVFVAEIDGKVIGFVKGTFDEVDKKDFPDCDLSNKKIFSLGSLYVLPNCRKNGVGTLLTKKWIKNLLIECPECEGMLTECYWRNNSQYFFNKLGAKSIGFCNIPDIYLNSKLQHSIQNITGEVMFWNRDKLDLLANNRFTNKEYTRKTQNYVDMVKARGNFEEYLRNKIINKGVKNEYRSL